MPDLHAIRQLLRIPNIFTAASNVAAAYWLSHGDGADPVVLALLVAASCCLYSAGMVLNDVFDAERDAVRRPTRPIPSGRVDRATAARLGWLLLTAGVLFGWAVAARLHSAVPGATATLLAACVVTYDGAVKSTPAAPLVMGLCRMLNVLLGFSPAVGVSFTVHPMFWCVAGGVGMYTVGLTWFARRETGDGASRRHLSAAAAVMAAGTALLAYFPRLADAALPAAAVPRVALQMGSTWWLLWGLFGFFTLRRAVAAIITPDARRIQAAVKQAIMSFLFFDAAVCTAARGAVPYGAAILLLLVPTTLLGRRYAST